jgi:DtxR family Mn-dependent transcriptional regulator
LTDILKIDLALADEDACKMEHAVSPITAGKFVEFMRLNDDCRRGGPDWLHYFDEYRKYGQPKDKSLARMENFARGYSAKIKEIERAERTR